MRKFVASVAAAATLATGGIAVAVLNPFQSAGAQSSPPTTAAAPAPSTAAPGARADAMKGVLDDLVAKGTITAAQRDAIVEAFKAKVGQFRPGGGAGAGGIRGRIANRRALGQTVATTLGITPQELQADLKSGKSIADIAASRNIPLQQVTDKLTAEVDARIDKAAASRNLDPARVATLKGKVPQLVDKLVNHRRS